MFEMHAARWVKGALLVLALLSASGCGDSRSPSMPVILPTPTPLPCASLTLSAAMRDPVGDAEREGPTPTPDLAQFQATVADCKLTMTMTFAHGTLLRYATDWQIELDTDENPATGYRGRDANHADAARFGAEYVVQPNEDASQANLTSLVGPAHRESLPFDILGDQLVLVIPLASLGNDDGRMAFSVTVDRRLGPKSFTTVLDYLPDLGAEPPRTK